MGKLRLFLERNKSAIFLLRYILIAIFLTVVVIGVDYFGIGKEWVPEFFLTKIDVARSILTALSGSFLTITTFTFSTILSVLSTYSSNYTPRVVENFLANKITMKVMGLFVGGFIYSIMTLFFMKTSDLDVMVLSATVAIVYTIYSVINFVIFIFSVSALIQSGNLIINTFKDSEESINRNLEAVEKLKRVDDYSLDNYHFKEEFYIDTKGYLELIELNDVFEGFHNQEGILVIHLSIGDFLSENEKIATLYYNDWGHLANEDLHALKDSIVKGFTLDMKRITTNDYRYSIQKLVEIALRAISPGINDPNTAIKCLHYIGVLLGKISTVNGCFNFIKQVDSRLAVVYESFNLKEDLEVVLNQIVFYGKEDLSVISAVYDSLSIAYRTAHEDNKEIIQDYANYVYENTMDYFDLHRDRSIMEKKYAKLNDVEKDIQNSI